MQAFLQCTPIISVAKEVAHLVVTGAVFILFKMIPAMWQFVWTANRILPNQELLFILNS